MLALLLALVLAAVPVAGTSTARELLLALGLVALACLAGGLVFNWSAGMALAAALLGIEWVTTTSAGWTPLVAAGLLLMTELGYWSFELRTPIRDHPAVHRQRAATIGMLTVAGGVLASVPLLTAEFPIQGGPLLTLVGAVAAPALLALALRLRTEGASAQ